jgi:zinc protease
VLAETKANSGMTQLTGRMLLKGTRTRSAEQIATEIESVGGSLDSYGGNNSFGVNAEVLSSDFATGLDLVADVLLNPGFPPSALEREREVQLASIREQKDHLLQSASNAMRRALFGEAGYGLDVLGTETSVRSIQAPELKGFYEGLARPDNCVLAIYGDVNTDAVKAAVQKSFGQWSKGRLSSLLTGFTADGRGKAPADGSPLHEIKRVVETRDKKQAVLVIGFPGVTLHDPDRYPLELVQEACSDLGSRLFMRIREKLGLAYYVGAQNFVGLAPGYFAFYAGTEPEKAAQVEKELLSEAELDRKSVV